MDKKKLLNKIENKELEEKSSPIDSAKQVTTTEKKKQNQKIQEELHVEKNLLSIIKKQEKRKRRVTKIKKFQMKKKDEIPKENNQEGSFSLTQILSVVSIVVSLAGLYYKRKELMSLVKPEKNDFRAPPIRELNLEHQRESEKKLKLQK